MKNLLVCGGKSRTKAASSGLQLGIPLPLMKWFIDVRIAQLTLVIYYRSLPILRLVLLDMIAVSDIRPFSTLEPQVGWWRSMLGEALS